MRLSSTRSCCSSRDVFPGPRAAKSIASSAGCGFSMVASKPWAVGSATRAAYGSQTTRAVALGGAPRVTRRCCDEWCGVLSLHRKFGLDRTTAIGVLPPRQPVQSHVVADGRTLFPLRGDLDNNTGWPVDSAGRLRDTARTAARVPCGAVQPGFDRPDLLHARYALRAALALASGQRRAAESRHVRGASAYTASVLWCVSARAARGVPVLTSARHCAYVRLWRRDPALYRGARGGAAAGLPVRRRIQSIHATNWPLLAEVEVSDYAPGLSDAIRLCPGRRSRIRGTGGRACQPDLVGSGAPRGRLRTTPYLPAGDNGIRTGPAGSREPGGATGTG